MSPAGSTARSVSPPLTGSPVGCTGPAQPEPPLVDVQTGLPPPLMLPIDWGAVATRRPLLSSARLGSPRPPDCGICTGAVKPVPAVPPPLEASTVLPRAAPRVTTT